MWEDNAWGSNAWGANVWQGMGSGGSGRGSVGTYENLMMWVRARITRRRRRNP